MKKNRGIQVLIFDLGGVLIDWNPYYLYCDRLGLERDMVDKFMKEIDFSGWNEEQDRGRSFADATLGLSARFPEYRDLIYAYDKFYPDSIRGPIQPVVSLLCELKRLGYRLYVLSNWSAEKFNLVRSKYPFLEWFDGLVISGEVGLVKPDKTIFELLLERINHPVDECLFVDDHSPNISVAKELGFQTILFQSAQQLTAELQNLGILDRDYQINQNDIRNPSAE